MNKMVIVAIRDKKADAFHPPYVLQNLSLAIRGFGDAVLKGNTDLSTHPEDFNLYHVGNYDVITGKVEPVEPVSVCAGLDFINKGE